MSVISYDIIKKERYAIFRNNTSDIQFSGQKGYEEFLGNNFVTEVIEPLVKGMKLLIKTEAERELQLLKDIYRQISPLASKETDELLRQALGLEGHTIQNLSVAFNLIDDIQNGYNSNFSDFKSWYAEKEKEKELYDTRKWEAITNEVLIAAIQGNKSLEWVSDTIFAKIQKTFSEHPKADTIKFKNTLKKFSEWFTPAFCAMFGIDEEASPSYLLSYIDEHNPYILKKRKEEDREIDNGLIKQHKPIQDLILNFTTGKLRGMPKEFSTQTEGRIATGYLKDISGHNIKADTITLMKEGVQIDTSIFDELGKAPNAETFNKKVQELLKKERYFRIEYSVKGSAGHSTKLKDAASLGARIEDFERMGKYMDVSDQVENLIFSLINSVPGFIADDVPQDYFARAIASLSFAFMFDIAEDSILQESESLVSESENRVHVYDVNGIYYTVSDVLRYVCWLIENSAKNYWVVSTKTIQYNGLDASSVEEALNNSPYTGLSRYEAVRNTILGQGSPNLGMKWVTIGSMKFSPAKDKDGFSAESSSGIRVNFNKLLKQMQRYPEAFKI